VNIKYNNIFCCKIRECVVLLPLFLVTILLVIYSFHDEIYNAWIQSEGREEISYVDIKSKLDNTAECGLCGSSDDSMMDYYRQFNTLGIISVNDWNVFALETQLYVEPENEMEVHLGTRECMGSTKEYEYKTSSVPSRGIAELTITLTEESELDVTSIQKRLCQKCLDKVLASLECDKWKNGKKEVLPMCLVDFQTLEIYSLQEISHKTYINDFYVKFQNKDDELYVEVVTTR